MDKNIEQIVTKKDIIDGLTKLGLKSGDNVMVHSSLKSFGHVEGGAETVISALMELLTEEGTLVMPSFNHGDIYEEGDIFDIKKTRTRNGIIPDTFWRMPGVTRSMNPTHSFAAWGKNAQRYLSRHHLVDTMGEDSPLGLLWKDGGCCLLLGVGYGSNTFHHFVETRTGAPCLTRRGEVYPVRWSDGRVENLHTWGWRGRNCPINDPARYKGRMAAYHRQVKIGGATVTLYPLRDGYNVIAKCLQEGLRGWPPCSRCLVRPRKCEWTV